MNLNKVFATVQDASRELLSLSDQEINRILLAVADAALAKSDFILAENRKDLDRMNPKDPKFDRLKLTEERLQGIAADTRNVVTLTPGTHSKGKYTPERHEAQESERPLWCHRHHIRGTPERQFRRILPLPEKRKRLHPERRQ